MGPAWPCWKRKRLDFKKNPLKEKKKYIQFNIVNDNLSIIKPNLLFSLLLYLN